MAPASADTFLPRALTACRRLFAPRGAVAFTLGAFLARLPAGMFTVSAVLMISDVRGSYALAGAVTAAGLVATVLLAPMVARLVDRHGQARIALPATCLAVCGSLTLVVCVRYGAPDWTLFVSCAATAATPNSSAMARVRWAHLHEGDSAALHTAGAFEQGVDELSFMSGPVLAAYLSTAVFPELGTLTAALLLLGGTLLFTLQRRTEPPVRRNDTVPAQRRAPNSVGRARVGRAAPRHARPRGGDTSLRLPGILPLLVIFLATGALFGSMEVVTLAYADTQGHRTAPGTVLACQALGSCAAGLYFGMARPRGSRHRRFLLCVAAVTGLILLPSPDVAAGGSLLLLAAALLLAGMGTAPTMVAGMTLVQRSVPAARLNEGMTLAVTALLCGNATGAAAKEAAGPVSYLLPPAAAALATLAAAVGNARTSHRPAEGAPAHAREDAAARLRG